MPNNCATTEQKYSTNEQTNTFSAYLSTAGKMARNNEKNCTIQQKKNKANSINTRTGTEAAWPYINAQAWLHTTIIT